MSSEKTPATAPVDAVVIWSGVDIGAPSGDWSAVVNGPWPFNGIRLERTTTKPIYGSLWRWLLRRPSRFVVTHHFVSECSR